MNPNHYLAVAIRLPASRTENRAGRRDAAVGKTLVVERR